MMPVEARRCSHVTLVHIKKAGLLTEYYYLLYVEGIWSHNFRDKLYGIALTQIHCSEHNLHQHNVIFRPYSYNKPPL
jgi:hypothetical protein